MATDLVAFLRARLDEDEAEIGPSLSTTYYCEQENGVHLTRARALREVEAKRDILAAHSDAYGDGMCRRCAYQADEAHDSRRWLPFPCPTVRVLTTIYAGHPDYREEWKP